MSEEGYAFLFGVVFCAFVIFLTGQLFESVCQTENNVADCDWSQSPFMPVIPEATP